MLIVAFLCFLVLVAAWIIASTPSVATDITKAPAMVPAPSTGD